MDTLSRLAAAGIVSPRDPAAAAGSPPDSDQFAAHLVWCGPAPLMPGRPYVFRLGGLSTGVQVTHIKYRIGPGGGEHLAATRLSAGEAAVVNIALDRPLPFVPFAADPERGAFTMVEGGKDIAVGAIDFALRRADNVHWQALAVDKRSRAALKGQRGCVVWLTGLSGSGKSTLANHVERRLLAEGRHTYLLDGDNVRHGLNKDLGFTDEARVENIRRIAEVAKLFVDAGLIVLTAFISPFRAERRLARDLVEDGEFVEIFVHAPIEECERRDPKGLYKKAREGKIKNFTGFDSPYEVPESPELVLDTAAESPEVLAERIVEELRRRRVV
ncbi:adenylyl-sulfate kinase [Magnetospirillum sp. UT-4]|uniref:adenylyl-sulfate kinase n=1 Tax=Magnetospirillum sp. UT-4 TaxID=2681467 RepID=UPI00137D7BAA|nr:adenylyl-sulfate kinase [Magnetospirillum sp. UT-4]CAA7621639.1 adenosine 5'-phosphosulfate kinase (modular protein) [Magnetospirillum sp. UT-4]